MKRFHLKIPVIFKFGIIFPGHPHQGWGNSRSAVTIIVCLVIRDARFSVNTFMFKENYIIIYNIFCAVNSGTFDINCYLNTRNNSSFYCPLPVIPIESMQRICCTWLNQCVINRAK